MLIDDWWRTTWGWDSESRVVAQGKLLNPSSLHCRPGWPSHLSQSQSIWNHLNPSQSIWFHLNLSESISIHLFHSNLNLIIFELIWTHTNPYKSIWTHLNPYKSFWSHQSQYQPSKAARRDDFPAPTGPTIPTSWPWFTVKHTCVSLQIFLRIVFIKISCCPTWERVGDSGSDQVKEAESTSTTATSDLTVASNYKD